MKIVYDGFECKQSNDPLDNALGNSTYGIHVCRFLDVGLKYFYSLKLKSDTVYVLGVSAFFLKFSLISDFMNEKIKKHYPNMDFSCIMSATNALETDPIEQRYLKSLVKHIYLNK